VKKCAGNLKLTFHEILTWNWWWAMLTGTCMLESPNMPTSTLPLINLDMLL
jgi:hypothetical protein